MSIYLEQATGRFLKSKAQFAEIYNLNPQIIQTKDVLTQNQFYYKDRIKNSKLRSDIKESLKLIKLSTENKLSTLNTEDFKIFFKQSLQNN